MSGFLIPKVVPTTGGNGGSGSNTAVVNTFVSLSAISSPIVIYASPSGPDIANPSTLSQQDKILGITKTSAAAAGAEVTFVSEGILTDPSFTFTPGPIYLGAGGSLTQVKPTSGLLVQVATAYTPTEILVGTSLSVILA